MRFVVLAFAIQLLPLTSFGEQNLQRKVAAKSVTIGKVDVVGELRTGIMAIGGETTGTEVKTGPIRFEVDVSASDTQKAFAAKHGGKRVRLAGTIARVRGVERNERWIITPKRLRAAAASEKADRVKVVVEGKVRHNVQAIGGETTGTTITVKNTTWELDLGKKSDFLRKAGEANGKNAVVSGTLEIRKGVEIPQRWIVKPDRFVLSDDSPK